MRAILLASATATTLNGRQAGNAVSQRYSQDAGEPAADGVRTYDKDAPQVAIPLLGDVAELLLASR